MENNLLKNDETISNNQNEIINTNTKSEVIGMQQNLNVQFLVNISYHAQYRYNQRHIEYLANWDELLMNSDFGVQVFNAILTKRVKLMKGIKDEDIKSEDCFEDTSFIYYNTKYSISIPLLWTNYMVDENGRIKIVILIKTIFWKDKPYKFNITQKGQQIFRSDKNTFGYDITNANKKKYHFNTLIPINFKIKNDMSPKDSYEAKRCVMKLEWRNRRIRIAAGCIRKSLSYIIDMWLSNRLEGMLTLTENNANPPLNVGVEFKGFGFKTKTFVFALKRMSFKELSYGENNNILVTNNNDHLTNNIISNGRKVQDGLKRFNYISETRLKQIIKESLLKYLSYIL